MKRTFVLVGVVLAAILLTGIVVLTHHRMRQKEANARLAAAQSANSTSPSARAVFRGPPGRNRVLRDPLAREALALVGADISATEIWSRSINNRDLPANERQDLIEDLNEEGFADPKNLTHDDLPLILSRLELIEQLAPSAVDDVNAAAFQEARKDLINMRDRILSQTPPSAGAPAAKP